MSGRLRPGPRRALGRRRRCTPRSTSRCSAVRRPIPPPVRRPVTVVLPVRDEEEQVGGCLAALLDQRGVDDLRIVVVDDGSTDGTAAVVRGGRRPPGPAGDGRPTAAGLARQAARLRRRAWRPRRPRTTASLAFVDADVRLFPDALAGAVAVLERHGLDLVSPWPRPVAEGVAERLVQPLVPWLWATTLPRAAGRALAPAVAGRRERPVPRAHRRRATSGPAATRRSAGEVLEDIALLRAVKRAGGRGGPDRRLPAGRLPDVRRLAGAARRLREVAVGRGRRLAGGQRRPRRRS